MRSSIKEPCYMLIGCISFFTSLSFFSSTYDGLKRYDLLADIKKEPISDSLVATDSVAPVKQQKHSPKAKPLAVVEQDAGMEHFFLSLDSLKKTKKKIRIAHFGDSMIEGDLITSSLREAFQEEFGGSGVGFVVPSPFNASFRQSLHHEFSSNWESINLKEHKGAYSVGISGYTSITNGATWIKLASKSNTGLLKIYYGNNSSDSGLSVTINSVKHKLATDRMLNEFVQPVQASAININFLSQSPVPIYGLSLESDTGIIIDNFSFRGSSGTTFKEYDKQLLTQFHDQLNYDLIILQYGINVANNKTTDYSWYERNMLANIRYLKSAFPDASFLIIGCSDRAVKTKGEYETSKGIEPLIETQKRLAQQTGSGFMNFYELMGGKGSMEKWVNGDTCFANKDYTHFNHKGAAKAGKIIYQALMKEYKIRKANHEVIN